MMKEQTYVRLMWLAWLILLTFLIFMASCQTMTEEHIAASADSITFSRTTGRKAASGGFTLSKDSLVMNEVK